MSLGYYGTFCCASRIRCAGTKAVILKSSKRSQKRTLCLAIRSNEEFTTRAVEATPLNRCRVSMSSTYLRDSLEAEILLPPSKTISSDGRPLGAEIHLEVASAPSRPCPCRLRALGVGCPPPLRPQRSSRTAGASPKPRRQFATQTAVSKRALTNRPAMVPTALGYFKTIFSVTQHSRLDQHGTLVSELLHVRPFCILPFCYFSGTMPFSSEFLNRLPSLPHIRRQLQK